MLVKERAAKQAWNNTPGLGAATARSKTNMFPAGHNDRSGHFSVTRGVGSDRGPRRRSLSISICNIEKGLWRTSTLYSVVAVSATDMIQPECSIVCRFILAGLASFTLFALRSDGVLVTGRLCARPSPKHKQSSSLSYSATAQYRRCINLETAHFPFEAATVSNRTSSQQRLSMPRSVSPYWP